jgi:hypothetical protein
MCAVHIPVYMFNVGGLYHGCQGGCSAPVSEQGGHYCEDIFVMIVMIAFITVGLCILCACMLSYLCMSCNVKARCVLYDIAYCLMYLVHADDCCSQMSPPFPPRLPALVGDQTGVLHIIIAT